MSNKTKAVFIIFLLCLNQGETTEEDSWLAWGAKAAVKTVAVGGMAGAMIVAAPVAIGFGAGGVVAGSIAATVQSTMGGTILAGSTFATLQSAGAAGIGMATKVLLGTAGAAAGYKSADSFDENKK